MALENLVGADKFLSALVPTNPVGADDKREGDDHVRGIKNTLRNTFPNLNAAVTATPAELSSVGGKVNRAGDTMTGTLTVDLSTPGLPQAWQTMTVAPDSVGAMGSGFALLWGNPGIRASMRVIHGGSFNDVGAAFETTAGGVATESMRLDKDGNLVIGGTASQGRVTAYYPRASSHGYVTKQDADTGPGNALQFLNAAASSIGSISTTGSGVAFNTTSDARLKTGIAPLGEVGPQIDAMQPREFEFIAAPGVRHVGFIAQELATVAPQAVTEGGEDPKAQPWSVDYSKLVPLLVRELQSLRARVTQLEQFVVL